MVYWKRVLLHTPSYRTMYLVENNGNIARARNTNRETDRGFALIQVMNVVKLVYL